MHLRNSLAICQVLYAIHDLTIALWNLKLLAYLKRSQWPDVIIRSGAIRGNDVSVDMNALNVFEDR